MGRPSGFMIGVTVSATGLSHCPPHGENGDAHMLGGQDPTASQIDGRWASKVLDDVIPTRVGLRGPNVPLSLVVIKHQGPSRSRGAEGKRGENHQSGSR